MAQNNLRNANASPGSDGLRQRLAAHLAIVARPWSFPILVARERLLQRVQHRGEQQGFKVARGLFIFRDILATAFASGGWTCSGGRTLKGA